MRNFLDNRYTYAKLLAAVGTAGAALTLLLSALGAPDIIATIPALFWIGGTLAAYVCGGLGTAIKMAVNIAKWGWLAVPFPFDIITFICAAVYALIVFFVVPLIPVCKAAKAYSMK